MKDKTNEDWTVREARREAMHEMEKEIPMLASERTALRNWVGQGNDPGNNPYGYLDEDDWPNLARSVIHDFSFTSSKIPELTN